MNSFSKTDSPCDCGWPALAINDPESGITFDAEHNTLALGHGSYPLYHCPSCGGKYPDSSRPIWVPLVPAEEFARVERLIEGLTDSDAIIARLGRPDHDAETYAVRSVAGDTVKDDAAPVRNLEYYGLSDLLTVEFYCGSEVPAWHRIMVKPLSPKHLIE